MESLLDIHTDIRQTDEWAQYMQSIGWSIEKLNNVYIFIRQVKPFKHSMIKVSHPQGPIPFTQIEELATKYNALFVLIEPHTVGYTESEYKKHNYKISHLRTAFSATRLIDLRPTEQEIFNTFSENARRNIKKAQKNNLITEHIEMSADNAQQALHEFYELYKHVGQSKNFYVLPLSEIEHKMNALKTGSYLSFVKESENTAPIAAVWYIRCKQTLFYMHVGITQEGYDKTANYLLVWEGLKYGKAKDMQVLDFESVYDKRNPKENKKWIGYSEFKSRFHGTELLYPPSWIKIYNPLFKAIYMLGKIMQ
jgi:lipid II:glycine glycyltransferase (peptidoglycan interpeptide bridge formation enzyme)